MPRASLSPIHAAYRRETESLVRQRLLVFTGIFVAFMGLGTLVEVLGYPERNPWSWMAYLSESASLAIGIALTRLPRRPGSPIRIGIGMSLGTLLAISIYHAFVTAPALRLVMTLGTLLGASSVIIPWGPQPQMALGLASITAVTVCVALGLLPLAGETALMPSTAIFATASITTVGALFLDRYRFEAFRRTTMQAEEAEIAAGLLSITQTLNLYLHEPDMLQQVTDRTVSAIACDFSAAYLLDPDRRRYVLAALTGDFPEARAVVGRLTFAHDTLPLFTEFRPGALVIIEDAATQKLIPPQMMAQARTASGIWAPIGRHKKLIGVVVAGYHARTGPFADKQQRLMIGIAHATAMALENRRLVTELEAANRLKSEFVATMSHELRTPLNIIAGYAEMIDDCVFEPGSPDWTDAIGRIRRSTEELNDLVAATLDLNRLEAGREPVDRQPVDLGPLLAGIESNLEPLAQPGVVLRWHLPLADGQVVTDGVKLKTIVKNLVANALKFTPSGSVEVTVGAHRSTLVIRVVDTGIGIAPEHLGTIFEMFRQIDGSSTRRFGGVGLGLHIVNRLVDRLGGKIRVESTPGAGSSFEVRLPDAVVAPDAARAHG